MYVLPILYWMQIIYIHKVYKIYLKKSRNKPLIMCVANGKNSEKNI